MAVFVLDKHKNPLMPISKKRTGLLLEKGRAVVIKMYPFTIRLKDRVDTVMSFVNKLQKILPVTTISMPKIHVLDAAYVGNWNIPALEISCCGRGSYQRTRLDKYGFSRGHLTRQKFIEGFQTGDLVKATVTKGKKIGVISRNDDYDYKVQPSVSEKIIRSSYKMGKAVH